MDNETDYILKEAKVNCFKTKQGERDWLLTETDSDNVYKKNGIKDTKDVRRFAPILVLTNFYSFFKCLEEEAEKGRESKILGDDCGSLSENDIKERVEAAKNNIERTKRKIENNHLNFLLNSSIWIRFCDNGDWNGDCSNDSTKTADVKNAEEEFKWFKELELYDFKPAKEYIEYQLRVQSMNYLAEIGAHDAHITPMLYSSEVEYRDFFIGEKSSISFKFLEGTGESGDFQTEDVALRILLVDDKIGKVQNGNNNVLQQCAEEEKKEGKWRCKDCIYPQDNNKNEEPCKLQVIKKLLSGDFISKDKQDNKRTKYNKKTYWADDIHSYCVDAIHIKDLWEKKSETSVDNSTLELKKDKVEQINKNLKIEREKKLCVQIIGVRDLESALALMSCCKFDVILLDYLLGKRTDIQTERVYSTELFEFLSYDFHANCAVPDIVTMLQEASGFDSTQLEKFRDEVKLNRGPLDKYWIVPMTSYNSSFIADLQRRNVRLIDHRWNISQGADPINTPWRFLYKLNEFVDLQLRSSVFWKKQLMTFIRYTCEDFKTRFEKIQNEEVSCFEEFQQFMGAEYANFMKRYGARKLIERDAFGDPSDQSLFAKYVNENFYNNYNKYGIETELNRLMQSFYYTASIMFDDRYGRQHLREAFERMRMFIAYNKLEDSLEIDEDKKKLLRGLRFLYAVIDSEFNCAKIDKWLEKNKQ